MNTAGRPQRTRPRHSTKEITLTGAFADGALANETASQTGIRNAFGPDIGTQGSWILAARKRAPVEMALRAFAEPPATRAGIARSTAAGATARLTASLVSVPPPPFHVWRRGILANSVRAWASQGLSASSSACLNSTGAPQLRLPRIETALPLKDSPENVGSALPAPPVHCAAPILRSFAADRPPPCAPPRFCPCPGSPPPVPTRLSHTHPAGPRW